MGGSGSSGKGGGQNSNDATDLMNSSMNNEDSVSSNCSSNNSFSSANLNTFPHSNQSSSSKSYSKPHQQQQLNAAAAVAAAAAAAAAAVTGQNHSMSSSNLLYPNSIGTYSLYIYLYLLFNLTHKYDHSPKLTLNMTIYVILVDSYLVVTRKLTKFRKSDGIFSSSKCFRSIRWLFKLSYWSFCSGFEMFESI